MIISELCSNHGGDLDTLDYMVDMSAEAGVWGCKIQTFFAKDLSGEWSADYYRLNECELNWEAHARFIKRCVSHNLVPITSVYSGKYAVQLRDLGFNYIKIGSAQALDHKLITKYQRYGFKIISSTGGVDSCDIPKKKYWALLHCVSQYPTHPYQFDLRRINELGRRFDCRIGLSSHVNPMHPNWDWPLKFAMALGASPIEVHFTTKARNETKDGHVSLVFSQLKQLCWFDALTYPQKLEVFPMLGMFNYPKTEQERELIKHYGKRWRE